MRREIPPSNASSSVSARVIDLNPEPSATLAVWWIALHTLVAAAIVMLAAPWLLESLALLVVLVHAIALPPETPPRVVYRSGGRVALPELGINDLTLGSNTLFTSRWVRFDLRGGNLSLDILLLADQVDDALWRALQAELRRFRADAGNAGRAKESEPFAGSDLR